MSRKVIPLGVLLLLCVAVAGYFLAGRMPGRSGDLPKTRHDYIAASARIAPGMSRGEVFALLGKPESDLRVDGQNVAQAKMTPAQRGTVPHGYASWYIGRKGDGDFWSRIFPPDHPPRQHLNVTFDSNDRVLTTSIDNEKNYLYDD